MTESERDRWRSAIGANADRYLAIFDRISAAGGWRAGWNLAAFLHSTGWFCYRRMYGWAFLNLFGLPLLFYAVVATWGAFAQEYSVFVFLFPVIVYLVMVWVLVPLFADSLYYRSLKRRVAEVTEASAPLGPSRGTGLGALAFGTVWVLAFAMVGLATYAYEDRTQRVRLTEAATAATPLRMEISDFFEQHKRLPTQAEAAALPVPRNQPSAAYVKSIAYDSATQEIVITLRDPYPDKRLAWHAQIRDRALDWKCRSVDVDEKLVPVMCRN